MPGNVLDVCVTLENTQTTVLGLIRLYLTGRGFKNER